jgi:hypothetical protein
MRPASYPAQSPPALHTVTLRGSGFASQSLPLKDTFAGSALGIAFSSVCAFARPLQLHSSKYNSEATDAFFILLEPTRIVPPS